MPSPKQLAQALAGPSWLRADGTQKGMGFLGPLPSIDPRTGGDATSTEISIGLNLGGKEVSIPTLVPTLNQDELNLLLSGGRPTQQIVDKAVQHYQERQRRGLPAFAGPNDKIPYTERPIK